MKIPDIFEFGTIISIPLFSIIALLLITKTEGFSFSKQTVSKSILFLKNPIHKLIFRINFLIKTMLDLAFVIYAANHFRISIYSLPSLSLILSALLFGSLAYFTEGKFSKMHRIAIYSSNVFWAVGQICLALLTRDTFFIKFTFFMVTIPVFISFGYKFVKKTNAYIQVICMSFWYIWLLVFVLQYL